MRNSTRRSKSTDDAAQVSDGFSGLKRTDHLRCRGSKKGEHPADAQNHAIFCREGEYWTIAYEGKTARLKDAKGLHYIAHLLAHPGKEIRALDLAARASGSGEEVADSASAEDLARTGVLTGDLGHAGEMLDAQAKADYQRRLTELEEELEEAREFKNEERIAKAEDEMEALGRALRGAIGLAGRDRRAASSRRACPYSGDQGDSPRAQQDRRE